MSATPCNRSSGPRRCRRLSDRNVRETVSLRCGNDVLARGFEAFRAIGGASDFLGRIERRERAILEALYAGARADWSEPPAA